MDFGKKKRFGVENCHTPCLANTDWHQISSSLCNNWNQPSDSHSLSFSEATNASSSTIGKPAPLIWNPSDSVEKGETFLSRGPGMLPLSLSHFSSEEAQMVMSGTGKIDLLKGKSRLNDYSSNSGSSMKDQSGPESPATKKRKRSNQDVADSKQKNSSIMATVKPSGKNSNVTGEAHRKDYIHVRARRGQATNSHSLAERVRREKISERMKFLQDLVPGCSKITGKAVMLDEIINYVQSLQRQVEFLSMKLAAVNPGLDFSIEGIVSKDFLQTRSGSSPAIGFSHDMLNHQLHSIHQDFIQVGMPGIMNPSDAFRGELNLHLPSTSGFKDAAQQIPNAWDYNLQNIVHMTYGNNTPLKTQDLNGAPHDGFPL